jgi:hypothetical protein
MKFQVLKDAEDELSEAIELSCGAGTLAEGMILRFNASLVHVRAAMTAQFFRGRSIRSSPQSIHVAPTGGCVS